MEQIPSGTNPADELVERLSQSADAKSLDAQRQRNQVQELYQKSIAVRDEAARPGEAARSLFDAKLKQEVLEAVWDAIEESAEVGAIIDIRLVSQEEGVQMTLDLRVSQLDISVVRARLPGSEFAAIAACAAVN